MYVVRGSEAEQLAMHGMAAWRRRAIFSLLNKIRSKIAKNIFFQLSNGKVLQIPQSIESSRAKMKSVRRRKQRYLLLSYHIMHENLAILCYLF
jgi:hypothetical protein